MEVPSIEAGVRLILRQMLNHNTPDIRGSPELHDALGAETAEALAALRENIPVWEMAEDRYATLSDTCQACGEDRPSVVHTWCGPHPQRGANASQGRTGACLRTQAPVPDGTIVVALRSRSSPAAWPFQVQSPLGMPISDSHLPNNILWTEERCPVCQQRLLIGRASCNIEAGELLRSERPPRVIMTSTVPEDKYIISFDGGARHRSPASTLPEDGPRAVGAGAAVWGPADHNGIRPCLAQITASVPNMSSSMAAEAVGLRAGLALAACTLREVKDIGVVGDNLPVIRLAAANGRVRTPGIWEILENPLIHIAMWQWQCRWHAVRRCYNKAADALATVGTIRAVDLAAAGDWRPRLRLWNHHTVANRDGERLALPWHDTWELETSRTPLAALGRHEESEIHDAHLIQTR